MYLEFYHLIVIAIVIRFIPLVKIPFRMTSTYFHELGHGLMAIVTFGGIDKIALNIDGSGVCHFRYRNTFFHFLITMSGYIATSVIGYYIYSIAKLDSAIISTGNLYILLGAIVFSIVLWVRDVKSFFLVLTIAALFSVPLIDEFTDKVSVAKYTVVYMQLIGVYVMLDALIAPFHLVDGLDDGDGGDLEKMTRIPEWFWIVMWVGIASYFLYLAYLL